MTTNQLNLDKYEGHTQGPWDITTWLKGDPNEGGVIPASDMYLFNDAPQLLAEVKRLRDVLEANLLVECDGCKNWLIEEQIMEHPSHTQWCYVCYSCSRISESDDE